MIISKPSFIRHLRMQPVALLMAVAFVVVAIVPVHAHSERPGSFADLADQLSPAVVNISTTTVIENQQNNFPQFPPGSPFEDFLEEFRDRGSKRQAQALGSGFIVDKKGIVVTNNHVIEAAVLMPITSPSRLNKGPPELPRLIEASVWMKSS